MTIVIYSANENSNMPELPELEAIKAYLLSKVGNEKISKVETFEHTVIRFPTQLEFVQSLEKATLTDISRLGKIMRFEFKKEGQKLFLDIDYGISGRLDWLDLKKHRPKRTIFSIYFSNELNLIYYDKRLHGSVWLFSEHKAVNFTHLSLMDKMGPDIMSITKENFLKSIKMFRGEIKRMLINQKFVSGIGNAYADEILYEAGTNPFTKVTGMSDEELLLVYEKSKQVLERATEYILDNLNKNNKLDNESYWRKNLCRVHLKTGELCPRCRTTISVINPRRPTNFCRVCQPSRNRNFI